jgi:hypothetical protein
MYPLRSYFKFCKVITRHKNFTLSRPAGLYSARGSAEKLAQTGSVPSASTGLQQNLVSRSPPLKPDLDPCVFSSPEPINFFCAGNLSSSLYSQQDHYQNKGAKMLSRFFFTLRSIRAGEVQLMILD